MKKGLSIGMVVLGGGALIYGVISMFSGGFTESVTWITAILGGIFFSSGIGLLKNVN